MFYPNVYYEIIMYSYYRYVFYNISVSVIIIIVFDTKSGGILKQYSYYVLIEGNLVHLKFKKYGVYAFTLSAIESMILFTYIFYGWGNKKSYSILIAT